jgi:hypothetical protein
MLSLPVNTTEEEDHVSDTSAPPSSLSLPDPAPLPRLVGSAPVPTEDQAAPPGNLVLTDPFLPREEPPVDRRQDFLFNSTQSAPGTLVVVPGREDEEQSLPSAVPGSLPFVAPSRPLGGPFWLLPLLWFNRLFDRLALGLGAPGYWLRGPLGRGLLGWLGLALLATALALVLLDHMSWTW